MRLHRFQRGEIRPSNSTVSKSSEEMKIETNLKEVSQSWSFVKRTALFTCVKLNAGLVKYCVTNLKKKKTMLKDQYSQE